MTRSIKMADEQIVRNGITIDTKTVKSICRKLIVKEASNLKTKVKNDGQMVKEIQNLIQEEVKCY